MKLKVKEVKEVDVAYLKVRAGVRYWEDSEINGEADEEGTLTPLREGEDWCPTIELSTGKILNWPEGVTADIHFKTCDDNDFYLLAADKSQVAHIDGYVINMLSPGGDGYGDYIIMKVDGAGLIEYFEADLTEFEDNED